MSSTFPLSPLTRREIAIRRDRCAHEIANWYASGLKPRATDVDGYRDLHNAYALRLGVPDCVIGGAS